MKSYQKLKAIKDRMVKYVSTKNIKPNPKVKVTIPQKDVQAVPSTPKTELEVIHGKEDRATIQRLTKENADLKAKIETNRIEYIQKSNALASSLKDLMKKLDGSIKNNCVYRNASKDTYGRDITWFVTRKDNGTVYLSINEKSFLMLKENGDFLSMEDYVKFIVATKEEQYPLSLKGYKYQGSNVKVDTHSTTTL